MLISITPGSGWGWLGRGRGRFGEGGQAMLREAIRRKRRWGDGRGVVNPSGHFPSFYLMTLTSPWSTPHSLGKANCAIPLEVSPVSSSSLKRHHVCFISKTLSSSSGACGLMGTSESLEELCFYIIYYN